MDRIPSHTGNPALHPTLESPQASAAPKPRRGLLEAAKSQFATPHSVRQAAKGDTSKLRVLLSKPQQELAVDSFSTNNNTAAMNAARSGHAVNLQLLLQAGWDPCLEQPDTGFSTVDFAIHSGSLPVLEVLAADPRSRVHPKRSAELRHMVANAHPDAAQQAQALAAFDTMAARNEPDAVPPISKGKQAAQSLSIGIPTTPVPEHLATPATLPPTPGSASSTQSARRIASEKLIKSRVVELLAELTAAQAAKLTALSKLSAHQVIAMEREGLKTELEQWSDRQVRDIAQLTALEQAVVDAEAHLDRQDTRQETDSTTGSMLERDYEDAAQRLDAAEAALGAVRVRMEVFPNRYNALQGQLKLCEERLAQSTRMAATVAHTARRAAERERLASTALETLTEEAPAPGGSGQNRHGFIGD